MLISVTTGDETFNSGSSKYHLFVLSSTRFHMPQQETHIGAAASAGLAGVRRTGGTGQIQAAEGFMVNMGTWRHGTYEVPDGLIMKLWGQRTASAATFGSNTGTRHMGALLIQTRARAALRRITCRKVGHPNATGNAVTLEGRFDLLTIKEAMTAGATLDMMRVKQFVSPDRDRLFTADILQPEEEAREVRSVDTVTTPEGKRIEVPVARKRRAVDFD